MSASRTGEQTEQSVKPFFFLTEDLPFPQNSGAKLRNWSILRILAEKAPVEILTFDDRDLPESDEPWMKRLRVIRLPSARAPVYRRALSQFMPYIVNGFSPAAAEIIRERARSHPDSLVWIAKLSMAKYIRTARNERLAVVLDEHNVESDL